MTESAQQPVQKPPTQSHDEEFFKEIEKRAYKGARKAIFHVMLMSMISLLIFWAVLAFAAYVFVIPYVSSLMQNQSPYGNSGQLNPGEMLKQMEELQR